MSNDILEMYPVQVEGYDITKRIADAAEDKEGPEGIPIALTHGDEKVQVLKDVLEARDNRARNPRRRIGGAVLAELDSFIDYVNRHKETRSVIFAEPKGRRITCYFDFHNQGDNPEDAGWCEFTADYDCPLAPEWEAWTVRSEVWMPSAEFAEFLDFNMHDLIPREGYPKPIQVLEMAKDLKINTKGSFSKTFNPTTGAFEMIAKQDHAQGSTEIHPKFLVALRPFQGGVQYPVEARVQLRIQDNAPQLRYVLYRKEEVIFDAFKDFYEKIQEKTELPIFVGRKTTR